MTPISPTAAALISQSSGEPPSTSARIAAPATADELAARYADAKTPADLLRDADLSNPVVRAFVVARMSEMQEAQHEATLAKAERLGIPVRIEGPGRKVSLLYAFRGDTPLYRSAMNANAAISTGANLLRDGSAPYNLDGTGIKVGVWDEAKVRNTHQEFPGSRVVIKDASTTFADHATHVAGTIGGNGTVASAKGMAPKVKIDSYDWNNDYTEMTAAGAATATDTARIALSNHSYGGGFDTAAEYIPFMGRYEDESVTTDALAAGLPYYLIFWAAGNEQDYLTTLGGYQSITFNGLAKNVLTIGAANDAVTTGSRDPAKATLAAFSSIGPCDDGRIKPDLVANGVTVYSSVAFNTTSNASSTTSYDTYSGTSMATPNAVGSATLVEQLYAREFSGQRMRASLLKGLLIHTADRGSPGPDYQYGWGLLNAKAAADLILAHKASLASPKLVEGSLTNSAKTQTYTYVWDGSSPLRATLSWTDPAGVNQAPSVPTDLGDSRTPNLVNDLDLKITAPDGTTNYLPFVMPFVGTWTQPSMTSNATTGINTVDNVEQVYLAAPSQPGTYTVTVTTTDTLAPSTQIYSLVVTGGVSVEANRAPTVTLDSPADGAAFLPGAALTLSATATDQVAGGGPGVVSGVEFFNGATSLGTDTTPPYTLNWTPSASGTYALTAVATDTEGASSVTASANVSVLVGDGVPTLASFTPTSGAAGITVTLSGTNFAGVTAVKFNGVDAPYTVSSSTTIEATVPASATTGLITVTTGFGTATSATSFTFVQDPVLISQIYGGGGNSGASYNSDYVELYNRSGSAVNLTGWSVQYASASGSSWSVTTLNGTLAAGKYYLVKLASGGATGSALPTPDAIGTSNISATNGKIALRNTATAFTVNSPVGQSGLQDLVGYGTASAFEGSAAPSGSNTTALFRAGGGSTDTANNAADFSAAAPNPRNTATGSPTAPVISSATTASGTVSQPFNYQITASNSPTSFAATGLPGGLGVNASGLISGTPTAAGVFPVTISASNAGGSGNATLTITIAASGGGGGTVTIFSENMGTPSGNTAIASHVFQNSSPITFAGTGDVRTSTPSTGYAGASGGGCVFITNTVDRFLEISGINTSGYTGLSLSLGHQKSTTAGSNELAIEVSADGTNYTGLTYTRPTGTGTTSWLLISPSGTIPSTSNLRIRFRQTSSLPQFRIDDVKLTGTLTAVATPTITATGTLAAVNTTYGTPSPTPATFSVSGAAMTAGILVTPPSGFEVSQTAGGASGYAATQTIGTSGTISATPVYVRLAATTPAGSYSGNVVCSSAGATSVNVATISSSVSTKALTVIAQNRTKLFGTTLTLGGTAFDATGLVFGQIIGSVTLTASGGTAAPDALGTYSITPSAATGGTFTAANYNISYQPGTLTVTAPTFAQWAAGLSDPAPMADPDADGVSNLIEYFMGLNPALADVVSPVFNYTGSELQFDYRRSKVITGVSGSVEWSISLAGTPTWSTGGVTDTFVSDQGTYEIRRASVSFTGPETAKFLRLRVSQP